MALTKIRENQISTATNAILQSLNFASASSVLRLPTGGTGDQPANPAYGTIRFNLDLDRAEIWVSDFDGDGNDGWSEVGSGGGTSLGSDSIIRANASLIDENIDIPSPSVDPLYENAFSKGPITINTGRLVQVGSNAKYTIF